jgi:Xaa-Pro aminopeptidase
MKSDLDRLMQQRNLDALIVIGQARENAILRYMTNSAKISDGIVVKPRNKPPVLICNGMEREEAAKSGLQTALYNDFRLGTFVKETGSTFEGRVRMYGEIFRQMDIGGTVSFYGLSDPGSSFVMLTQLGEMYPHLTITGETDTSIFDDAFMTKDSEEIARIKLVAERANQVFMQTIEFIKGHQVKDAVLMKEDNTPLTVLDVKHFVRRQMMDANLEDGGEMIFAVGRDAGVPHSRGEDNDPLMTGKSIIFDFFPRSIGSGYYHDMTRTFCLGYAPSEVQEAYDQVAHVFHQVMEMMSVGAHFASYHNRVCDFFKEQGHANVRDNPATQEGYVHGLGHGLGLEIHERPSMYSHSTDIQQTSQVVTIEPGLYYPDRGFGVRIEDTVYIDEKGELHSLTPTPKDLVIPVG